MSNNNMKHLTRLIICLLLVMMTLGSALAQPMEMSILAAESELMPGNPDLIGDGELPQEQEIPTETEEPTQEPVQEPTTPPTMPPTAAYEILMAQPEGWYANRAVMELTVTDKGGTGWSNIRITMERSGATVTLIDGPLPSGHIWLDLLDNCIMKATVTDPSGKLHSREVTIACFDKDNPILTASVKGEYLNIEATDGHSGIAAVQVNGTTYTELNEGKLEIWLKEYADAYEQLIVQAVDKVGNVSKAIAVANPFFKHTNTPTTAPTPTPKPAATTKPTATPKPTQKPASDGNNPDNSTNNNGGSTATATPTPTAIPTIIPEPIVTPEPIIITLPTPIIEIEPGIPITQNGNAVTRDLLYDKHTNKQFIGIESRNGDVFYVVIDYDKPLDENGEQYETYFLNLVDSRDMLDIVDPNDIREPEIVYVTPEPTVQPTAAPVPVPTPDTVPEKKDNSGMIGLLGLLVVAGGGAFWYFKICKPSEGNGKLQSNDYDYEDEDDDEPDEEMVNEDE